jgi:DNA-binding transcriptional ArsR family regulator
MPKIASEITHTLEKYKMSQLYLRFLNFACEVDIQKTPVKNIDLTALTLLNEIAVQNYKGKNITVTEAMLLSNIASPATVHRKLDELREAGLIEQVFEGKNRRTKYLVPTKEADSFFAKMSKAITNAVNS